MPDESDETGRIVAFKNPAHEAGSKQPAFKGTICPEGSGDKRPVALWARISQKTGKTYMTGRAGHSATAQIDNIAAGEPTPADEEQLQQCQATGTELAVDPHQVILFRNDRKEPGSKQPDYFGYYSPGTGTKLQRLDVWAKNDKFGKPMLSGNVTHHKAEPKNEMKAEPAPAAKPNRKRALTM